MADDVADQVPIPSEWVPLADVSVWVARIYGIYGAFVAQEIILAVRRGDTLQHRIPGIKAVHNHALPRLPPGLSDRVTHPKRITVTDWEAAEADWTKGTVGGWHHGNERSRHSIEVSWRTVESFVLLRQNGWKKRTSGPHPNTRGVSPKPSSSPSDSITWRIFTSGDRDLRERTLDHSAVDRQSERAEEARNAGLIESFIKEQSRNREWICFAEIADWCSRKAESIHRIEPDYVHALWLLHDAIERGEFESQGRMQVAFMHESYYRPELNRDDYNGFPIVVHKSSETIDPFTRVYLESCWVPRNLCRAWFEAKRQIMPPWLSSSMTIQAESRDQAPLGTVANQPQRTGFAGRPAIWQQHLFLEEVNRRLEAGETESTITKEAKALALWHSNNYPDKPRVAPKTIQNSLGTQLRKAVDARKPPK